MSHFTWLPQPLKNLYHRLIALIAMARFRNPAGKLTVIGVTGTDGKTTTTTLIYHILKHAGFKVATITSVAAYINHQAIDTGFHVTTPDSWLLQKLLRKIVDEGCTHVVLEVTSHGLDQNRVMGTNIKYSVITNITHEHLDYHKNYLKYLNAKAKILKKAKLAILNADDDSYKILKTKIKPGTRVVSYGMSRGVAGEWLSTIKTRFQEKYNQLNCLAAITLASEFKVKKHLIKNAILSFPGISGRQELIQNKRGLNIIVDFAHTPNGLKNALTAMRERYSGKLIAIFGAAGLRDTSKRPIMGKISSELADEVIFTSEDPRTEDPRQIIRELKNGITKNHGHIHSIIDRREAIYFALNKLANSGDTVAIFGKGHEKSINLDGSHELPWSDQDTVRQILI